MRQKTVMTLSTVVLILALIGCASMLESLEIAMDERTKSEQFKVAISNKDMRKIRKLIKTSTPEEKRDGLFLVIKYSKIDVVSSEKFVDPPEVVRLFLEGGVDVNSVQYGCTPLLETCWLSGNIDCASGIVKLLLKKGADVNAVDELGKSALRYAVEKGRADIVRLLIQYGADVNVQYNGRTLVYMAQVSSKNTEIANLLRDAGSKPAEKEELAIQKAIEAEKLRKQKEAEIAKLKENLKRGSENFYNEVIYRKGTPIKAGDEFLIDKNRIEVLDRTTIQAGYTYLVTYFASAYERTLDYARSFYYGRMYLGNGTRYCFYIVSKKEMALHNNYSYTVKTNYITSVNDLKLTCIGEGKYQQNYQDVPCYVFTLDAEL